MIDVESLKFPTGRTVQNCRKDAKRLARTEGIQLCVALDRVAIANGAAASWARAMEVMAAKAQKENDHRPR